MKSCGIVTVLLVSLVTSVESHHNAWLGDRDDDAPQARSALCCRTRAKANPERPPEEEARPNPAGAQEPWFLRRWLTIMQIAFAGLAPGE